MDQFGILRKFIGKNVIGAVDGATYRRTRPHPGQVIYVYILTGGVATTELMM